MQIRRADRADWAELWPMVKAVVDAGATYVWRPTPSPEEMQRIWFEPEPWHVVVAEQDAQIVGTRKVGPNRPGRGAHVSTAAFIVGPDHQGRGVGRALAEYAVRWAQDAGFLGMQFNAVVSTNGGAIALWKSLGFSVIGTVPRTFDHRTEGLVDLHIMYRDLSSDLPLRGRPVEDSVGNLAP